MRWVGQHVYDLIAKFRADIEVGDPGAGDGFTIDSDSLVGTSSFVSKPLIQLTNTNAGNSPNLVNFFKTSASPADGDNIAQFNYYANNDDDAGVVLGMSRWSIADVSDGAESGKYVMSMQAGGGSSAGQYMFFTAEGAGENIVDIDLGSGSASLTKIKGNLRVDGSDFNFDNVALTAIQTSAESFVDNDTSLMTSAAIQDEVLSTAPAVTLAGTPDYITISGQEITRNAVVLTTDVSGTLPVANGGTGASSLTDNKLLTGTGTSAVTAEANATYDGADLSLISTTSLKPIVSITNSHNDANSSELLFINNRTGDVVAQDDDEIGKITFQGTNDKTGGTEDVNYGRILCDALTVADGAEMGRMTMSVGRLNAYTNLLVGEAGGYGTVLTFGDGGFLGANVFNSTLTTFQSTTSTGPLFTIANLTNDATSGSILFLNDRGQASLDGSGLASSNGDDLGKIDFKGYNSTPAVRNFAQILAEANEVTAGSEEGKITISVASHDGELQPGLMMVSGDAEDEVDVTIGNVATSLTTIAGTLTMGSTATINNSGVVQVAAQTVIDHDQLANFAPQKHYTQANIVATGALDSGSITSGFTSIDVGAGGITTTGAISGGTIDATTDFTVGTTVITDDSIVMTPSTNDTFTIAAAANGATTLTTVDTAATAAHFEIAADGNITLDAAGNIALEAGNGSFSCDAATVNFTGVTSSRPSVNFINNSDDASGPKLAIVNLRDGNGLEDGDALGTIDFQGEDAAGTSETYGSIVGSVVEADHGDEAGQIAIFVANDGTERNGITMTADKGTAEEVDVIIANGAASTTTIAGNIAMAGNLITHADHSSGAHMKIQSGRGLYLLADTDDSIQFGDTDSQSMQWDEENSYLGLTSANASQPVLEITNTHDGTTSGELKFTKNSTGDDSDVMGLISFYGTDSSDNAHERLAYMDAIITDSAHGSEAASLRFYVAENDATLTQGLLIAGQADADGEVDVTIGAGVASTTTVAGNMVVTTRLTASNQFSIGGHVVDDIDLAGEFVDSDNHLMTSAAIDDRIAAAGGGSNKVQVSVGDPGSYIMYLYHNNSWYSLGSSTLAILGTGSSPSDISSANSEYGGRAAIYAAPSACVVKKLVFTWYWTSSSLTGAKAFEFSISKYTPITNGSAAIVTMNTVAATDHDGNYTEFLGYQNTFTLSGDNATLAAGDCIAFHVRSTDGASSQRLIIYGNVTLEAELS